MTSATTEVYTEFSDEQLGATMDVVLGGVEAGLTQTLSERASHRVTGAKKRA